MTAYLRYLQSAAWAATRKAALQRVGSVCQDCGGTRRLEVHHLTYDRLGAELPGDLRVLCHECHQLAHGRAPRRPDPIEHISGPIARFMARAAQAVAPEDAA